MSDRWIRTSPAGPGTLLAFLAMALCGLAQAPLPELTRIAQVRELTPEQADRGYPVRVKGIVTFNLPDEFLLFVQDETAGVYLFTSDQPRYRVGQLLEITGVTARGDLRPIVGQVSVRELGESALPKAIPLDAARFLSAEMDSQRAELTGVVRRVVDTGRELSLFLGSGRNMLEVLVGDRAAPGPELSSLIDARVRASGVVITTTIDEDTRVRLGIPSLNSVQVIDRARPGEEIISEAIGDLRRRSAGQIPERRVRVAGVVIEEWNPGQPLLIRDDTGTASIKARHFERLSAGDRIEAVGFVPVNWSPEAMRIGLEDARLTVLERKQGQGTGEGGTPPGVISSLGDLRALAPDQVVRSIPVRVRGVVTLFGRTWGLLFIQDRSGAVYVRIEEPSLSLTPGQIVEVEGVSEAGGYAPVLAARSLRVVGTTALPVAPERNLDQLSTGGEDCNLVEFVGGVRQVEFAEGVYRVHLESRGSRLEAVVFGHPPADFSERRLEDSLVRVRGVCGAIINSSGQLTGVRLFLQDFNAIQVLEPSVAEPFELALTGLGEVLRFTPSTGAGQRRRVQGTVGYRSAATAYLYGGADVLRVRLRGPQSLEVGDLVEAVGYPSAVRPSPVLEDTITRKVGSGFLPEPLELTGSVQAPSLDREGRLVRLNGWLLTATRLEETVLLTLQGDGRVFHAEIPLGRGGDLARIPPNSLLSVTGVYSVLTDESFEPRGFKVLLRDGADITILQTAPRITVGQALVGLAALGLMVLVVLGWVYVLRGRIQRHEERFRKVFQAAPLSLHIVTVRDGRIMDVNPGFLELWGYQPEQVVGRTEAELGLWVNPEERLEIDADVRSRGTVRDREIRLRTGRGEERSVLLSVEPVKLEAESCFLLLCHDISERLSLEAQLLQAQKMESVGRLAAGVAHDFNNLLTVIQGHAQMLLTEPDLPPSMADSLRLMEQSAIRGAGFTRQLLTFSRKQVPQRTSVDLLQLVRGMGDMLRRLLGESIWLEIKGLARLPFVDADPSMVEQLIMNLAVNARDAMPQGGTLTIGVGLSPESGLEPPEMTDRAAEPAGDGVDARPSRWVVLTVRDTGVGMPQGILPHIFDPFFTTKEVGKGTGLGLATVYGIVKQHGGKIEVDSEVGTGTTFRVILPASRPVPVTAPADQAADAATGQGEIVMVVEDEVSVRRLVAGLLQRRGFRVVEAASGPEAVRLWQQQWRQIDFLLSDMVMPGGISGLDLARSFRRERPDLPVILMSGYSEHMIDAEVQEVEKVVFLPKPFPPSELVRAIRDRLDGGQAT